MIFKMNMIFECPFPSLRAERSNPELNRSVCYYFWIASPIKLRTPRNDVVWAFIMFIISIILKSQFRLLHK